MADLEERAKVYAAEQMTARRSKSPVTTVASTPDPQAEADWLAGYAAAVEDAARAVEQTEVAGNELARLTVNYYRSMFVKAVRALVPC